MFLRFVTVTPYSNANRTDSIVRDALQNIWSLPVIYLCQFEMESVRSRYLPEEL